jgi:hypothetical protein
VKSPISSPLTFSHSNAIAMHFDLTPMSEEISEEQQRTLERRLATYSASAIKLAVKIDRVLVAHTDFNSTLRAMDRVFQLGKELSVPQGVALIGPPGSGKSTTLQYFMASLPTSTLFEAGLGVVRVRLPERPSLGRVVSMMLTKLRYPFPKVSDHTVGAKRGILIEALRSKGTRMIGIDEAGHMCGIGVRRAHASRTGNEITELCCELMDEAQVALMLCGNEQLSSLDRVDPALGARVTVRQRLKDFADGAMYEGFLTAFKNQSKDFDLSFLVDPHQASNMHKATNGNPRHTKSLFIEGVLVAAERNLSCLNSEVMAEAFARLRGSATLITNPWLTSRPALPPSGGSK